jgi:hypothetical protein
VGVRWVEKITECRIRENKGYSVGEESRRANSPIVLAEMMVLTKVSRWMKERRV